MDRHWTRASRLLAGLLICVGLALSNCWSARADSSQDCPGNGTLYGATVRCVRPGSEVASFVAGHSDHAFVVSLACETENAVCPGAPTCKDDDHMGQVYDIWEDGV